MSDAVEVQADPERVAGHAVILIRGGRHFAGPVDFRIRRADFDAGVFGANGWQVADALLTPERKSVDGDDLLLHIGPSIVQHIDSGVYHFALPAAGLETTIVWPDLPLLGDAALNIVAEPVRSEQRQASQRRPSILRNVPPAPSPEPNVPRERPGVPAEPMKSVEGEDSTIRTPPSVGVQVPPKISKNKAWLWLIPALVVFGLAGGYVGYRWLYLPLPIVLQPTPEPPQQINRQPPPAATGPNLENMTAIDAIRSRAPADALLREAERRLSLGGARTNDALLLMQAAADRGYAPAHAALGRFYDPNLHPPATSPDAREAALHYRAASRGGDNSSDEARSALKSWLEQQAQHDDLYAPLILKEFWP